MKTLALYLLFVTALFSFVACGGNDAPADTTTDTNTETPSETNTTTEPVAEEDPFTFNAKFVGFELHDAAHFFFEDEKGKKWDFGSSRITNFQFESETEEGFAPNPELLNKTFKIKYEVKQEPLYIDGPIGDVMVIVAAELVE